MNNRDTVRDALWGRLPKGLDVPVPEDRPGFVPQGGVHGWQSLLDNLQKQRVRDLAMSVEGASPRDIMRLDFEDPTNPFAGFGTGGMVKGMTPEQRRAMFKALTGGQAGTKLDYEDALARSQEMKNRKEVYEWLTNELPYEKLSKPAAYEWLDIGNRSIRREYPFLKRLGIPENVIMEMDPRRTADYIINRIPALKQARDPTLRQGAVEWAQANLRHMPPGPNDDMYRKIIIELGGIPQR